MKIARPMLPFKNNIYICGISSLGRAADVTCYNSPGVGRNVRALFFVLSCNMLKPVAR